MCTLTYIPQQEGFILSSNRDEKIFRSTLPPREYMHGEQQLIYPRDETGGGSWIAVSSQHRAACLLNGAFVKHSHQNNYRISRGKVLLESFGYSSAEELCQTYLLEDIEPFTLVMIDYSAHIEINELRWDGQKKHLTAIDPTQPHIWSSVTLYDQHVRRKREKWFYNWLKDRENINSYDISEFHTLPHTEDAANDILMQRSSWFRTVSLSQLTVSRNLNLFKHYDLLNHKAYLNLIKDVQQLS